MISKRFYVFSQPEDVLPLVVYLFYFIQCFSETRVKWEDVLSMRPFLIIA